MRLTSYLNESTDAVEIDYNDLNKNKRLRKKFKSQKEFEKWLDKNEGDVKVNAFLKESFASGIDKEGSRGPTEGPTSPISGMSKQKAKAFLYKGTKPFWYNKIYKDEYWQGPKSIWNYFDSIDLNWQIDSSKYRKPGPGDPTPQTVDVAKEWLFTIWLDNDKGHKLHGQLIASGAGSVSDPLEKYDMILIFQ